MIRTVVLCVLLVGLIQVVGCSSADKSETASAERPTRESVFGPGAGTNANASEYEQLWKTRIAMSNTLHSYGSTRYEEANRLWRNWIIDFRGFNEDVKRVLLLDRPSRSTLYPVE